MFLPISGWWQAAISAALTIGVPEVFAVIAVVLLGREWFDYLLTPVKRLFRRIGRLAEPVHEAIKGSVHVDRFLRRDRRIGERVVA